MEKVTVVIAAHNEEKTIKNIINETKPFCDNILVVMSKRSSDNTKKIVESMKVNYIIDHGKGKGEALRCAINHITNGIIVFMDSDGSHITKDIPALVKPLQENKADLAIASRFMGGSMELHGDFSKFMRMFLSMGTAQVINWRFNTAMGDVHNGYRAIKANVAKDLNLKSNIFDIEVEMVMKCLKKRYKVVEVPSRELRRKYGESGINLWTMGGTLVWRVIKNLF